MTEPQRPYQICTKTVMDTSDPDIQFDESGICHHYHKFQKRLKLEICDDVEGKKQVDEIVRKIKIQSRNKQYDCVIGLSGGVDSCYVAYLVVKKMGLNPLAVHLDNGWNSELAVGNIEKTVERLGIDLYTVVLDWVEFRELQKAFFRSSVGNVEMITDHAINACLFERAREYGLKYIISGSNLNSEGIMQSGGWGHDNKDWVNIRDINRRFGTQGLKGYPRMGFGKFAYSIAVKGIRFLPILNYFAYDKAAAMVLLEKELHWRNYGRKHGESVFTRFFQEYYLPKKFGVDKRRSHYSSLICSGQMTRDEALAELEKPLLSPEEEEELVEFVCKKLGFGREEWAGIMAAPPVAHTSFKTSSVLGNKKSWIYQMGRRVATGRKKK